MVYDDEGPVHPDAYTLFSEFAFFCSVGEKASCNCIYRAVESKLYK